MDRGWSAFPVYGPDPTRLTGCSCPNPKCENPGKHPATPNGLKDATRDFDIIESMWPEGAHRGLAIATGEPSGVWALDIDGREALDRLLDLQSELGKIPTTVTSRTSRGFHLLFQMPTEGDVRNSASKVAPGIDVRGTGGYIIIEPSGHASGIPYSWAKGRGPEELAAAEAPRWLLDLVQKHPRAEPPPDLPDINPGQSHGTRYVQAAIEAECLELASLPPDSCRNETLNRAAYSLSRFIVSGEADAAGIRRALTYAARACGLPQWEIDRTLKSAFKARGAA